MVEDSTFDIMFRRLRLVPLKFLVQDPPQNFFFVCPKTLEGTKLLVFQREVSPLGFDTVLRFHVS